MDLKLTIFHHFLHQGGRPPVSHFCRRLRRGVSHPKREQTLQLGLREQVQVQEEEVKPVNVKFSESTCNLGMFACILWI